MKTILITGSAGLVGSECVNFFLKKKFRVIGLDNNMRKSFFGNSASVNKTKKNLIKIPNYTHYNFDIRNHSKIEGVFKKYSKHITAIIHSAAQPSHDWAYKKPITDFDINSRSTLNLLLMFKKYCNKACFIFLSTNKVYGDTPNKLNLKKKAGRFMPLKNQEFSKGFNEKVSLDNSIHSFFGASKLYGDIIVQEFGKNFKLKTVCFRAGCITGPQHAGTELHGFLSFLIKNCIKNKKYKIFGYGGNQVRDNIHSKDLVNCFWEYMKKPTAGEVYNIGGGIKNSISINEALKFLESKLNIIIKKTFYKSPRSGDHAWYVTDYKKFQKTYPAWKPKYNIQKILNELINYHKSNYDY